MDSFKPQYIPKTFQRRVTTLVSDLSLGFNILSQVTVWEWSGPGLDEGDDAAQYISDYMGIACRLVRYLGTEEQQLVQALQQDSHLPADAVESVAQASGGANRAVKCCRMCGGDTVFIGPDGVAAQISALPNYRGVMTPPCNTCVTY